MRLLTFAELDQVQKRLDTGDTAAPSDVQRLIDEIHELRYRVTAASMSLDGRLHNAHVREASELLASPADGG